jgi:hypothetical protein
MRNGVTRLELGVGYAMRSELKGTEKGEEDREHPRP